MLPLAVALSLHLTPLAAPPDPPTPLLPPRIEAKLARLGGCPDIDPHFVRYVAPPEHWGSNPLLWRIAGAPAKLGGPPVELRCLRAIQAADRR